MYKSLVSQFPSFMNEVFDFLSEIELDVASLTIDHAAVRYASVDDADACIQDLKNNAQIVSEVIVSERKVYVCKLNTPLTYKNFSVQSVELLYPGTIHTFPRDGWEHIEFVLPVLNPENFEEEFTERFPHIKNDLYPYKIHIHEKLEGQLFNPTIFFEKYRGLAIKFHPYSIIDVVTANDR